MDFGANITPAEIIKKRAFGGSYFRDIYSSATNKWYKDFNELKNIDQKYYCSNYYDVSVNEHDVECGISLRF